MAIQAGAVVLISGRAGDVFAKVCELHPFSDLPPVGGFDPRLVEATAAALGWDTFALFAHYYGGQEVCFVGTRSDKGQWYDLAGQKLTITEVTNAQAS